MPDILDRMVRIVGSLRESLENPTTSLSNPAAWLWEALGARKTASGVSVNTKTAMGLSAFWGAVKIISETHGSVPLITYRELGNGTKERAKDRPEYGMLHDEPNPQMTSFIAREIGQAHLLTWGNAYFLMQFNRANKVKYIWPLRPEKTRAVRTAGQLVYETTDTPDGKRRDYVPEEICHIPGLSFDGLSGLSPVAMHRETIGHGIATKEYGASFFGGGGQPGGVLEVPEQLEEEPYNRLKKSFAEQKANPHATVILEAGTKYHVITVNPEDAQFIETMKFNISDMARIHRIPLAMLEEHDKAATYASVEQFFLYFAIHTMRPWAVRWEQELNRKIFGVGSELSCEFLLDGLYRGDMKSRNEAYHVAVNDGYMTWNDVARKENMNLIPAEQGGDTHWVPANVVPVERALRPPTLQATQQTTGTPPPNEGATRHGPNGKEIGGIQ